MSTIWNNKSVLISELSESHCIALLCRAGFRHGSWGQSGKFQWRQIITQNVIFGTIYVIFPVLHYVIVGPSTSYWILTLRNCWMAFYILIIEKDGIHFLNRLSSCHWRNLQKYQSILSVNLVVDGVSLAQLQKHWSWLTVNSKSWSS